MKMRLLILSLMLFSSALFAQNTPVDTADLVTLQTKNYSIQYPRGWKLDTGGLMAPLVFIVAPQYFIPDTFFESIILFDQDLHGENYTLLSMAEANTTPMIKQLGGIEVLESRADSSVSPARYIFKYRRKVRDNMVIVIHHYYFEKETAYGIKFTMLQRKEEEYLPLANKIFNSFRILK